MEFYELSLLDNASKYYLVGCLIQKRLHTFFQIFTPTVLKQKPCVFWGKLYISEENIWHTNYNDGRNIQLFVRTFLQKIYMEAFPMVFANATTIWLKYHMDERMYEVDFALDFNQGYVGKIFSVKYLLWAIHQ